MFRANLSNLDSHLICLGWSAKFEIYYQDGIICDGSKTLHLNALHQAKIKQVFLMSSTWLIS